MGTDLTKISTLGEQGEVWVMALLSRIFNGKAVKYEGLHDKGSDLVIQFSNPLRLAEIRYFGVQVKTGKSYVKDEGKNWKIQNVSNNYIDKLNAMNIPILFVWVNHDKEIVPYWTLITKESGEQLYLSKHSVLSPITLYDFLIRICIVKNQSIIFEKLFGLKYQRLVAPLNILMRNFAREYYKKKLLQKLFSNKEIGEVKITWSGWRHITRKGRKSEYIYKSLEILPIVKDAISNSNLINFRRLKKIKRGNRIYETRLLILNTRISVPNDSNAKAIIAIRERINYPIKWKEDLLLFSNLKRELVFESIYF